MNDVQQPEGSEEEESFSIARELLPGLLIFLMAVLVLAICWGLFQPQISSNFNGIVGNL